MPKVSYIVSSVLLQDSELLDTALGDGGMPQNVEASTASATATSIVAVIPVLEGPLPPPRTWKPDARVYRSQRTVYGNDFLNLDNI